MPTYTLNVNGTTQTVTVSNPSMPLLWVLRDIMGLTGTKYGCGIENCGACAVLVNGQVEYSCDMDISEAAGATILTVEGLANDPVGKLVQAAWVAAQVPQCGYCQPGMMIAATGAIKAGHHAGEIAPEIKNLCMCGTYPRVAKALLKL